MTSHLLLVTLGPVQDFIAQARRTRDLWYGSHLLSELSRCAAHTLAYNGAKLIFPALDPANPEDKAELEECLTPFRPKDHRNAGEAPLNIANKILAEVPDGKDPAELAKKVRCKVQEFWARLAKKVKDDCSGLLAPDINDVWDEQITTFIEFTAAWTEFDEATYVRRRKELENTVAARKNLRDFEPWKACRCGAPASSLDGARQSVLAEPYKRAQKLVRKYRIGTGEQLDAIGLVKRDAGSVHLQNQGKEDENPLQFVPLASVGLAPWIKEAKKVLPSAFNDLEGRLETMGYPHVGRSLPCVKDFKFDAALFLENHLWAVFKDAGCLEPDGEGGESTETRKARETEWKRKVREWGQKYLEPILTDRDRRGLRKPFPYAACLVADGDRMGAAIGKIAEKGPEAHRDFSRELAKFAREARDIVESETHLGSLVYAGGDDVLAFLPLRAALDCAEALRTSFREVMRGACGRFEDKDLPTLSVGIGIGHLLENMGDLVQLGRDAEKLAKGNALKDSKQQRNALAVIVDKRSGGRREWRAKWEESPVERLKEDVKLLGAELSGRKVYEIAGTLRRFPKPGEKPQPHTAWADMLAAEVRRSLSRIEGGTRSSKLDGTTIGLCAVDKQSKKPCYEASYKAVSGWINRMLIAKTFAEAAPLLESGKSGTQRQEAAE